MVPRLIGCWKRFSLSQCFRKCTVLLSRLVNVKKIEFENYVSIVATCIAVHFAVCHALYNNKNKKIGKNRCLVFLNDLVLFCNVILSL